MSFIKGTINHGPEKVKFFVTPGTPVWEYVVTPRKNIIIGNMPFEQERKSVLLAPGQILDTDDVDVIKFLRNRPEYSRSIKEVGVHTKTDKEVDALKEKIADVDAKIEKEKVRLTEKK